MATDERYWVNIIVAAPGTPLRDGGTSLTGHMYLETGHGDVSRSMGLQPDGAANRQERSEDVPAKVGSSDVADYQNPYYTRRMEITKDQYDKLNEFADDPKAHGFEMSYNAFGNSCTNFAWEALNHAGIHKQYVLGPATEYRGEMKVLHNIPEIKMIRDPVEKSDLNDEFDNDMPERTFLQKMLSQEDGQQGPARTPEASSPRDPNHPDHALLNQINGHVAALDARNGREFDATSERISASLLGLAKENELSSVDHVLLSERTAHADAAQNIFIVQGQPDDPAHLRASMPTELAAQTPVEASFEHVQQLAQQQDVRSQEQAMEPPAPAQTQSGPTMA